SSFLCLQRITVVMEKQDNQTFGFEIQTYGLQLKDSSEVEMCTSISKVHEDSAAESAGLTAGDIIITINGASIEGLSHQNILDLVRKSDNSLMMETVCGSKVKQIELEKRMSVLKVRVNVLDGTIPPGRWIVSLKTQLPFHLRENPSAGVADVLTLERRNLPEGLCLGFFSLHVQQTLREKLVELQALIVEEKRLTQGEKTTSLPLLAAGVSCELLGQLSGSSPHLSEDSPSPMSPPAGRFGLRFSSDSSFKSAMTDDSELASVFGDLSPPCPFSAASTSDDGCFFSKDFPAQDNPGSRNQRPLGRTSSSSLAGSSSSLSPSWEETRISNLFGTLPRKSRKTSVRKHIFKLLPGLQRSVEEEE
ncbi:unnamed protein product, partial [Tetraodon nigroviridis]